MEGENKNRTVILFGAGAVRDFRGPTTGELTELIKSCGFYCSDNKTRITEFISRVLKEKGYDEDKINFETIINVVEDFIIHYSNTNKIPSLSKTFFSSRFENDLLNFSIVGGEEKRGFKLEIPKGKKYDYAKSSFNEESPEQLFFLYLLENLLTHIDDKVSKYTYHTERHSLVITDEKKELNENFQNWIKQISENSILRMYTLNYDRVFKILSERVGIKIFEGFDSGEFVPQEEVNVDLKKILSDFNCNTHYNLHGSVFWKIKTRENGFEIDPQVTLKSYPGLQINNPGLPMLQMEKGKNILMTNIITGYHKTQKSFISPFRQMQSAFDRDCMISDDIWIIGYSFGDEHINTSIKNALNHNDSVVLHFVDPSLFNTIDVEAVMNNLEKILIDVLKKDCFSIRESQKKMSDNYYEYFEGKIKVNIMGMKDFLNTQKV